MPWTRTFVDPSRRMLIGLQQPHPGPAGRTSPRVGKTLWIRRGGCSSDPSSPIPALRAGLPHKCGRLRELDDLLRPLPSADAGLDPVLLQDLAALLLARAAHAHDQGQIHLQVVARSDPAPRHLVATRDAAADVDQHALDLWIHEDDGE